MKLRFLHEHEREPGEVERLVGFAVEPLKRQTPVTVAVKVNEPSPWATPSGVAYEDETPRWAGRARYAITLRLPSEHLKQCRYGLAHVCYHASDYRSTYVEPERPEGIDEAEWAQIRGEKWRAHTDAWHALVQAAYDRGERKWGRWPLVVLGNWREALVYIAAHEGMHVAQFVNGRVHSEIECELHAARRLEAFRSIE